MWIDKRIANPLKEGKYKCLVSIDDYGNLAETEVELYNGKDWDVFESNSQFISFWWSEKEDYETITSYLDNERDNYMKQMEEESKNFGGL